MPPGAPTRPLPSRRRAPSERGLLDGKPTDLERGGARQRRDPRCGRGRPGLTTGAAVNTRDDAQEQAVAVAISAGRRRTHRAGPSAPWNHSGVMSGPIDDAPRAANWLVPWEPSEAGGVTGTRRGDDARTHDARGGRDIDHDGRNHAPAGTPATDHHRCPRDDGDSRSNRPASHRPSPTPSRPATSTFKACDRRVAGGPHARPASTGPEVIETGRFYAATRHRRDSRTEGHSEVAPSRENQRVE